MFFSGLWEVVELFKGGYGTQEKKLVLLKERIEKKGCHMRGLLNATTPII